MAREAIISPAYTGHTHYMSPYECYDSCGTCDGAHCYRCDKVYEVTYFSDNPNDQKNGESRIFYSKTEAEEYKRNWEESA